ncbi:GNAT family N-acetyltransferase [uncultured Lactobacillus sp.]|uniref:GNAT family N-acetyltransferase n=1 Tax=uncultured Lactobacillus sp. TaxID=153152 RepID=UPI00261FC0D1|nr:GNAT family N-acetyltransferase [uncultured Lactobacillus sp.]
MIRKAERRDFPFVFPILNQIFEEMDMKTIKALPEGQFYELMQKAFYSNHYRYSLNRIWVDTDGQDKAIGLIDMYSYEDQAIIDMSLKPSLAKAHLPQETEVFTDQEALPGEWYIDALAVSPDHWGEGIGSSLLAIAPQVAKKHGYNVISLNVDQDNPRAQRLYEYKGFETVSTMQIGERKYDHMIKRV